MRPRPGSSDEQPSSAPLFGLAPGGACRAGLSPGPLVGSYPTVSPLPAPPKRPLAVCSLLRFPAAFAGWTLSSALLCGVRTFLDGRLAGSRRASRRGPAAATWLAPEVYHRGSRAEPAACRRHTQLSKRTRATTKAHVAHEAAAVSPAARGSARPPRPRRAATASDPWPARQLAPARPSGRAAPP